MTRLAGSVDVVDCEAVKTRIMWTACAALLALTFGCAASSIDESAFTREMAERVAQAALSWTVGMDGPLTLKVHAPDADDIQVNLNRVFDFCSRSDAQACENSKQTFVGALTATFDSSVHLQDNISRDQLQLVIRAAGYCNEIVSAMRRSSPSAQPLVEPFAEDLCTIMMVDLPTARRTANMGDLKRLGLERAAAWKLARTNVLAPLPKMAKITVPAKSLAAIADLQNAPSLMLDSDGWRELASRTEGTSLLAVVPSDQFLGVARESSTEALAALQKATRQNFETAERGVSPLVYRWTASGWQTAK